MKTKLLCPLSVMASVINDWLGLKFAFDAIWILTAPVIIRWYKIPYKPFTHAIDTLFIGIGSQQTDKHINIWKIYAKHQDKNSGPSSKIWHYVRKRSNYIHIFSFLLSLFCLPFFAFLYPFIHRFTIPFESLIEWFCSKSSMRSSDLYRTHYFNNIVIKVECS